MDFQEYFPIWNKLNTAQQNKLLGSLISRNVHRGTVIRNGGMDCTGLLLVKTGQLRTYILSDEGREITLYRLFDRDMCLFSASCILRSIQFEVTIPSSLWAGLLAGTLAIPVLYYAYTWILGRDVFLLDLATFLLSVVFAFWLSFRFTLSCRGKPYGILLGGLVCVLLTCFLWFTYHPPETGLFADPTARAAGLLMR